MTLVQLLENTILAGNEKEIRGLVTAAVMHPDIDRIIKAIQNHALTDSDLQYSVTIFNRIAEIKKNLKALLSEGEKLRARIADDTEEAPTPEQIFQQQQEIEAFFGEMATCDLDYEYLETKFVSDSKEKLDQLKSGLSQLHDHLKIQHKAAVEKEKEAKAEEKRKLKARKKQEKADKEARDERERQARERREQEEQEKQRKADEAARQERELQEREERKATEVELKKEVNENLTNPTNEVERSIKAISAEVENITDPAECEQHNETIRSLGGTLSRLLKYKSGEQWDPCIKRLMLTARGKIKKLQSQLKGMKQQLDQTQTQLLREAAARQKAIDNKIAAAEREAAAMRAEELKKAQAADGQTDAGKEKQRTPPGSKRSSGGPAQRELFAEPKQAAAAATANTYAIKLTKIDGHENVYECVLQGVYRSQFNGESQTSFTVTAEKIKPGSDHTLSITTGIQIDGQPAMLVRDDVKAGQFDIYHSAHPIVGLFVGVLCSPEIVAAVKATKTHSPSIPSAANT